MAEHTLQCPRCGNQNIPESRFCNKCGNPLVADAAVTAIPPSQSAGSKAIIALILGIFSIFMLGFLAGIPAMILAKHEEDEIRRGRSPVAGEMLAKLGFWLGLIGTVLSGLTLLFVLFIIFFGLSFPFIFSCAI
jgi:hypothetical protein